MRRIYVLDTSVLIYDPCAYKQFKNSDVCIPIAVLSELDKLKKQPGEVGKASRVCSRLIDEICNRGDISVGILLDDDILLKIDATYIDCNSQFPGLGPDDYPDTHILACALLTKQERLGCDVCLVSNDINLRVKARARGIDAESFDGEKAVTNDLYSGMQTIANEDAGLELLQRGQINPIDYGLVLSPNECITFKSKNGDEISLGRQVSETKIKIVKKIFPWNIVPRNTEQIYLIDMIMNKDIDLVTCVGFAGCGKSLCVLAAALELVLNKKLYEKLIIYRPIQSVGNDLGYLPGLLSEKLEPYFSAIMDSFEFLFSNKAGVDWRKDLEMFIKKGRIELGALPFIRGKSIANSIIFLDEAQNISPSDIKTILTRAGESSKIIIDGDVDQIDVNNLDSMNNGLTYVIERFRSSQLAGHITLINGERSRLATEAAKIL